MNKKNKQVPIQLCSIARLGPWTSEIIQFIRFENQNFNILPVVKQPWLKKDHMFGYTNILGHTVKKDLKKYKQ